VLCEHCQEPYKLEDSKTFWDENGTYSIKFSICPYCYKISVVKSELYFEEDINNDIRYYIYNKKNRRFN
jgi:hypothetical protein